MTRKLKLKEGDIFTAKIRRGPHSMTLEGKEGAGTVIGPFVVTRDMGLGVEIEDGERFFAYTEFILKKVSLEKKK